jgi:hypothetical protein
MSFSPAIRGHPALEALTDSPISLQRQYRLNSKSFAVRTTISRLGGRPGRVSQTRAELAAAGGEGEPDIRVEHG